MAGLFYPPAFAALTGWYGPRPGAGADHPDPGRRVRQHHLRAAHRGAGRPAELARQSTWSWRPSWAWSPSPPTRSPCGCPGPARHAAARHQAAAAGPRRGTSWPAGRSCCWSTAMTLSAFALYAVAGQPGAAADRPRPVRRPGRLGARPRRRRPGRRAAVLPRPGRPARHPRPDRRRSSAPGGASRCSSALLPGPAALLIAASVLRGRGPRRVHPAEATVVSDHWGPQAATPSLNGVFNAPLTAAGAIAPSVGRGDRLRVR